MPGSAEGTVNEGAEAEGTECVQHLTEHDGDVVPDGVCVATVEGAVELRPGARTLLEVVG